ncbi:MAG: CHAT domain-containing tetratricopeptide repeat protein, partial [Thermodesulfobacteriota bacterium]
DKALKYYQEALSVARGIGNKNTISNALSGIGSVYYRKGEHKEAIKNFEEALKIKKQSGYALSYAVNLYNLGSVYYDMKDYAVAASLFLEAVTVTEKLRSSVVGDARLDFMAKQIDIYQFLTSAYIRAGDNSSAFRAMETGRARYLSEQIAAATGAERNAPSLDDVQKSLSPDTAVIVYSNINRPDKIAMLITKTGDYVLQINSDGRLRHYSHWEEKIKNLSVELASTRGMEIVERDKTLRTAAGIKQTCSCDAIVNYYRLLLIASGEETRGMDVRKREETRKKDEEIRELAKTLYKIFFGSFENNLKRIKKIVFVTDGALGFLPFDTLIDDSGRYLVERFDISYIQSMGVMDLLKKRGYDKGRRPVVAFGGAIYDMPIKQYTAKISEQISIPDSDVRGAYQSLGMGSWGKLPYTFEEVKGISNAVQGATVYAGENASEGVIKGLSASGELSRYKVLHFATHAMVVPAVPELSSIVLSQFEEKKDGEDGYLKLGEILGLKLNADLVNLSACDTAIGKVYEGEGVVGLTQAFLMAGANGVSVTLWQVADESTARFMVGMYELVNKDGLSYPSAITEMKRRFASGKFGEAYKKPYYWAPFVYYGKR